MLLLLGSSPDNSISYNNMYLFGSIPYNQSPNPLEMIAIRTTNFFHLIIITAAEYGFGNKGGLHRVEYYYLSCPSPPFPK